MNTKRNYKSIDSLKNKVKQLSLYNLMSQSIYLEGVDWIKINDLLTNDLIDNVCELLGGHAKTKERMFNVINRGGFSKWYLERIFYSFSRKCFTYCAGQDYPAELREIRKDLVNRY
jgi:dissimilatory sulfite reductase (desulfoviridin) alpha/beta subunit